MGSSAEGEEPRATSRGTRKSDKTAARLRLATVACARRAGYADLKIADICAEAGTGVGTFYFHFRDKEELCLAVLRETVDDNIRYIHQGDPQGDAYSNIFAAARRTVETFEAAGPGGNLFLAQIIGAVPAARNIWFEANARIVELIVSRGLGRRVKTDGDAKALRLAVYAALQTSDTILLNFYAWQDRYLVDLIDSPEALAEVISLLWYRSLYGAFPPSTVAPIARSMLGVLERSRG